VTAVQAGTQRPGRIAAAFRLADELAASALLYHDAADKLAALIRGTTGDDWQDQYLSAEFRRACSEGNGLAVRGQMIRRQAQREQAAAGCAAEVADALAAMPPLPELPPLVLAACNHCARQYGLTFQPGGTGMPGGNDFNCARCTAAEAPPVIIPRRADYGLRDYGTPGARWVVLRLLGDGMCEIRRLGFPDAPSFTVHSSRLTGGTP
jgi:hypothetical protein